MKVCIVNSHKNVGGAAAAAFRLKEALQRHSDLEVSEFVRFTKDSAGLHDRFSEAGTNESVLLPPLIQTHAIKTKRSTLTNTLFSPDGPAWDLSHFPEVAQAEIINLHWVTSLANGETIRRFSKHGKKIVWTMHDERPFTGGCHYTAGCRGFETGCHSCEQLVDTACWLPEEQLHHFMEEVDGISIQFVSPSRWLASELEQSKLFQSGKHKVSVIPNSLDTEIFCPVQDPAERKSLREKFDLPESDICIVAGSVSWNEERKGARFLEEAIWKLSRYLKSEKGAPAVRLVTYGSGGFSDVPLPVTNVGTIESEAEMARLLKCCDLNCIMTREDNLPNTIVEALACGLPVIATDVGGVPDMVEDEVNGLLVPKDNSEAMASALLKAVQSSELRLKWSVACRKKALKDYSHRAQAASYTALFRQVGESIAFVGMERDESSTETPLLTKVRFPAEAIVSCEQWRIESSGRLYGWRERIANYRSEPSRLPGAAIRFLKRLRKKRFGRS